MNPLAQIFEPTIEVSQRVRMKKVLSELINLVENNLFDKLERDFVDKNRSFFDLVN